MEIVTICKYFVQAVVALQEVRDGIYPILNMRVAFTRQWKNLSVTGCLKQMTQGCVGFSCYLLANPYEISCSSINPT